METKLDSDAVVAIINSCNSNGVLEFTYNGLSIKFRGHGTDLVKFDGSFPDHPDSFQEVETPSPVDKTILEDVRLSQLMIDDPFGFEHEIVTAEAKRSMMNEAVQD